MTREGPLVAIYPGSFDPITRGHEDIARRALRIADHLLVAVAHTATHAKKGLFSVEERVALIRDVFAGEPRVEAVAFQGLLVDFAKSRDAHLAVRGLRAVSDFEYEFQMAQMNQELWPDFETVCLAPEVDSSFISASLVREVASLGGEIGRFVSPQVSAALQEKLGAP